MSNILKNEKGSLQPNYQEDFKAVSQLIHDSRIEAQRRVNETLIKLYWDIGSFIHDRVKTMGWGRSTVEKLSSYILDNEPGIRGFSARNIWRMKQFFETYENNEKLSAALTEFPVDTKNVFKDSYLFEFTGLHNVPNYKEFDLKHRLLKNLKTFLMELGPDFAFVGEEYLIQVGNKDYFIDLLLHHRGLNCLICCELKVTEFKPEHLGKLEFYLEALDQTVKQPHENPSIGLLISKTKDDEVVKFAMNRNMSPALVAEYKTKLIEKPLLQQKLHEITEAIELNTTS